MYTACKIRSLILSQAFKYAVRNEQCDVGVVPSVCLEIVRRSNGSLTNSTPHIPYHTFKTWNLYAHPVGRSPVFCLLSPSVIQHRCRSMFNPQPGDKHASIRTAVKTGGRLVLQEGDSVAKIDASCYNHLRAQVNAKENSKWPVLNAVPEYQGRKSRYALDIGKALFPSLPRPLEPAARPGDGDRLIHNPFANTQVLVNPSRNLFVAARYGVSLESKTRGALHAC